VIKKTLEESQRQAEDQAITWLAKLNNTANVQPEQEHAFMAWLESSPKNQVAYLKAEQLWARGSTLQQLPQRSSAIWNWSAAHSLGLACSVLLMIGMFLVAQPARDLTPKFQTSIGEIKTITLIDGSTIALNTNSSVHFEFSNQKRVAYLDNGEVFFDVQADSERPFDVVTNQGVVRVMGTRFSVRNTTSDDTTVTVIQGKVALGEQLKTEQTIFKPLTVLTENERINFSDANQGIPPATIDANTELSWRKQRLIFTAQPLHEVIAELNQFSTQQLVLGDASLATKNITAVIQLKPGGLAFDQIGLAFDLRVEVDTKQHRIIFYDPDQAPKKNK